MTMLIYLFISLASIVATAQTAEELSVEVYEGDTECDDSKKVKSGDFISIHYTGKIDESSLTGTKNQQIDSSRDRDEPIQFQVGSGDVIPGWDTGMLGLCLGAKANMIIPPGFGYGEDGLDVIPGGATLNFDVEVVDISRDGPPEENMFEALDANIDGYIDPSEIEAFFKEIGEQMPENLIEEEDKDNDGKISWEEFAGPKGDKPPPTLEEYFLLVDGDKDGKLSKSEVENFYETEKSKRMPADLWTEADADLDGFLNLGEVKVILASIRTKISDMNIPQSPESEEEIFDTIDTDKDDKISKEEMEAYFSQVGEGPYPTEIWSLDVDKNGFITRDEFQLGPIDGDEEDELPKEEVFNIVDENKDGKLSKEELDKLYKEETGHPFPTDIWDEEDRNKDGFITLDEFQSTIDDFSSDDGEEFDSTFDEMGEL